MVIPIGPASPYRALLDATPADVKLTVVNGQPRYGDAHLMARFFFLDAADSVVLDGRAKRLVIGVNAPTIPESGKSLAEILANLEAAYQASEPKLCDFLGVGGDGTGQVRAR